jgi:hypothetical protein
MEQEYEAHIRANTGLHMPTPLPTPAPPTTAPTALPSFLHVAAIPHRQVLPGGVTDDDAGADDDKA